MGNHRRVRAVAAALSAGLCLLVLCVALGGQSQTVRTDSFAVTPAPNAPKYKFDPDWPKPLPNKWKMGGITGLAVDSADDVWVLTRPNDTTDVENRAAQNPPIADCCVRPPAMIHFDKEGNVIGSFDARQGHGMAVDNGYVGADFIYIGSDTVRRYDAKDGKLLGEIARVPETQPQAGGGGAAGDGAPPAPGAGAGRGAAANPAAQAAAVAAFRTKYPPTTPMIVGNIEEIRLDLSVRELYCTDSYLGGRVMVFDMDTFKFKRGWGAYGKPLSQISTNDADHAYTPNGPMPKEFRGHLTLNLSSDGLVYIADRIANRIQVTDKQGKFLKEFIVAPSTGAGGSTGGIAFSGDRQQRYLYISDITNNTIWFLNREDGKVLGRVGSMGDNGGQFYGLHMIATDSKGNIYTGEVQNGERVQRFVPVN